MKLVHCLLDGSSNIRRIGVTVALCLGFAATSCPAFMILKTSSGKEQKWPSPGMTYYINAGGAPAGFAAAAITAGKTWDGSGSRFRFTNGGTTASHAYGANDGKNIIDFGYLSGGSILGQSYRWFNSSSGRLLDADIRLNSAKSWGGRGYDVQSVLTHEMGHSVGLADLHGTDSGTKAKTMYYQLTPGDTSPRMLDPDDMAGIRYLYRVSNGDDLALFDRSNGRWYIYSLSKNDTLCAGKSWGYAGVTPVGADFDNDGRAEMGVYDQRNGAWYVYNPRTDTIVLFGVYWGFSGTVPVPADYDGDGYAELAVYHAAGGKWYIYNFHTRKSTVTAWGFPGAQAVPADYDGDGCADIGVYYPPTGAWFIYSFKKNMTLENNLQWGFAGTVPVVGDYNGDGIADLGVYHASSGLWFVFNRITKSAIASGISWGFAGITPLAGDFNGDSRDEMGLYYSAASLWYAYDIKNAYGFMSGVQWGYAGLIPVRGDFGP